MMAVSAVPGSGKTHTLAALATRLIRDGLAPETSEVLVVTFTNSAVDTIQARIRRMLDMEHLPPDGFRVMTLHSLANQIVRERPDLAGTVQDFRIDDELSGRQSLPDAARNFILAEYDYWRSFLPPDLTSQKSADAENQWRETTQRIGNDVTRLAKNLRLTPAALRGLIAGEASAVSRWQGDVAPPHPTELPPISPFLRIGAAVYDRYERILSAGGRLDFDDLIWRAITALNNDDGYRRELGRRWLYILEDEAQDSTPLQEEILGALSRDHGNWVRMGDPNQAIMTTFTASDVRFFRDEFPRRPGVRQASLATSGRSAQPIIDLANRLADWAVLKHPEHDVRRTALSNAVRIEPVGPGDPQQNPPADECIIHTQAFSTVDAETQKVADSAIRYVLEHPDRTCGVLAPTNAFGRLIVSALTAIQDRYRDRALFEDQLRNTLGVRNVARVLGQAVRFCSQPTNTAALISLRQALATLQAWQVRVADGRGTATNAPDLDASSSRRARTGQATNVPDRDMDGSSRAHSVAESRVTYGEGASDARVNTLLRSAKVERLLFPETTAEPALPERVVVSQEEQAAIDQLTVLAAKWVRASVLPADQLVLSVAHDVLKRDEDLAVAHSLAVSLRRYAAANPQVQLADLGEQLDDIAANRQKYLSDSLIETGFEPAPGVITVTTMHKAKGLEWDRVYLTSVDQVEFPHDADSAFRGEQWYLEGRDPATEARTQLYALYDWATTGAPVPDERELVRRARLEYIAERLRLLYVGITRARRDVVISYSKERWGRSNELALAVQALLE